MNREHYPSIQTLAIGHIKPDRLNARTHSKKQIRQIANSIVAFGFTNPLLVDDNHELIAGHGRWEAAGQLGLATVPVIVIPGLSPAKRRALAITDNRLAENARWSRERLAIVLPELASSLPVEGLDLSILGFEPWKLDQLHTDLEKRPTDQWDRLDPKWFLPVAVTEPSDSWLLGSHQLLCGDPCSAPDILRLMNGCRADLAFLDLNVRGDRAADCGELQHSKLDITGADVSTQDIIGRLSNSLDVAVSVSREGAVHILCMEPRHIAELMPTARSFYGEALDVAVWAKPRAARASRYRSDLELFSVFCVGSAPPPTMPRRRSRTNVWHYTIAKSLSEFQPQPKPVALVADAIRDFTRKGAVVLDLFSGSGTTIMAAERVGRLARALEVDPRLVDLTIRRWQAFTGEDAIHAERGLAFDQIAAESTGTSTNDWA